jgi:hypothetical protein
MLWAFCSDPTKRDDAAAVLFTQPPGTKNRHLLHRLDVLAMCHNRRVGRHQTFARSGRAGQDQQGLSVPQPEGWPHKRSQAAGTACDAATAQLRASSVGPSPARRRARTRRSLSRQGEVKSFSREIRLSSGDRVHQRQNSSQSVPAL